MCWIYFLFTVFILQQQCAPRNLNYWSYGRDAHLIRKNLIRIRFAKGVHIAKRQKPDRFYSSLTSGILTVTIRLPPFCRIGAWGNNRISGGTLTDGVWAPPGPEHPQLFRHLPTDLCVIALLGAAQLYEHIVLCILDIWSQEPGTCNGSHNSYVL